MFCLPSLKDADPNVDRMGADFWTRRLRASVQRQAGIIAVNEKIFRNSGQPEHASLNGDNCDPRYLPSCFGSQFQLPPRIKVQLTATFAALGTDNTGRAPQQVPVTIEALGVITAVTAPYVGNTGSSVRRRNFLVLSCDLYASYLQFNSLLASGSARGQATRSTRSVAFSERWASVARDISF